jgi:thiol-disulfide isomerase/thioredoxin
VNWRRPLVGPFSALQIVGVLAAVIVTAGVLALLNQPIANTAGPSALPTGATFFRVGDPVEGLQIGDLAPELTGMANGQTVSLTDLDGNPITLASLRGRPIWINFWASWCPPCQAETPVLTDIYNEHKDEGLALLAVSVQETTADDVRSYVDRYKLPFTVGFDVTSAIFHTYHAYVLPTQIFIDRDGIIRNVTLGQVNRENAEAILAPLLAEGSPAPGGSPPPS